VSFRLLISRFWGAASVEWWRGCIPVPLLLLQACTGSTPRPGWGTPGGAGTASYQQCVNPYGASNPACIAAGVPPGQALTPAAIRGGQTVGTALRATEALQRFITVTRFLDQAEQRLVESIVERCVKEANTQVDEELFGQGRSLPDSECKKEPTVQKKLAPTWRRHLGILKHAAAFACIGQRLSEKFPQNFSIEPRYRRDELTGELMLTDRWIGSKQPDFVLHFTRNATRIQCVYELKFPCGYEVANTRTTEVEEQLRMYAGLGGECKPALVTPQQGVDREW
jgi:hypothetical protein